MSKRLDVEYCKNCEDISAFYPQVWLAFENVSGETIYADEKTFECPRCYTTIERYKGFIEALEKRDSPEYLESVLEDVTDLSIKGLETLCILFGNFTVPSFATHFTGTPGEGMEELIKKRYIDTVTSTGSRSFAVLNAYKLGLLNNVPLLEKMGNQQGFIWYPEYRKVDSKHTSRRKARKESLVDDFTDQQRSKMFSSFGSKCALTGKDVPLHVDHVMPLAIGHGGTTASNMLPIWQRINSSKGAKNIFEWYEENGDRFEVLPELFDKAIEYLADLNEMTTHEYRDYVYECHANPNDILTEVI